MTFCNRPDESRLNPASAQLLQCYIVTKALRRAGGMVLPGPGRAQRADDELVPVAFEVWGVSGAVCAGVPARGFVRPRASRTDRAACGGRERARRRAAIGRRPHC